MSRIERRVVGCRLVLQSNGDGPPVGRLVGELDVFDADDLARILRPVLASLETVLDLDGLTFVDLGACRALLALVGPPDGVRVIASPGTPCRHLLAWLVAEDERDADPDEEGSAAAPV